MIKTITKLARKAFKNESRALHSLAWYDYAGEFCAELDKDYELRKGTAAGIVAALSPLNSWEAQLKFTPPSIARGLELLSKGQRAHEGIQGPGFFSNRDKAARILAGEDPLSVLGGDKVRSFYRNLTGDSAAVTIDRHAIAISGWTGKGVSSAGVPTSRAYSRIATAFKFAGENVGLLPCQVQALTWCYWREVKNGRAW